MKRIDEIIKIFAESTTNDGNNKNRYSWTQDQKKLLLTKVVELLSFN